VERQESGADSVSALEAFAERVYAADSDDK
jgi:hypothetical protein